jgi:putative addiction module component (TIGR02574 family)
MIRNTAKVVTDALSLPPRSRARLADKLLESLDQPKQREIDNLWAEEAEDRIDAYEKGEIKVLSGKEVFRKLRMKRKR